MGAALTIPLGAGTGLRLEDTRHRLALCRCAFLERKLAAPALVSLSTTRELCAVAGAQDVVRGHIELFGMLLYVYSEGV